MEAYELFEGLVGKVNKEVASYLMDGKLMIEVNRAPQTQERKTGYPKYLPIAGKKKKSIVAGLPCNLRT